ncbi:MAG: NAD(P)H-dependent oxidoreductase [Hyphomicrobiaceae bacterium]
MSEDAAPPEVGTWNGKGARVLVLSSSPRIDGNSRHLAESLVAGAQSAGHDPLLVDLSLHVTNVLRDCRSCRKDDGQCAIEDRHKEIFDLFLAAEAVVYATPIWWYGISGQLKAFIDRIFCFISDSYPDAAKVRQMLPQKRAALLLSAEESNFAARLGIVEQMSELCRYLDHQFVGIVTGIGNRRGEVTADPADPMSAAFALGRDILKTHNTDYGLNTERSKTVWQEGEDRLPSHWR